jgi:hypothetical protein
MLLVFLYIVNLMRKKRLDFKFALGWLLVLICITVLTIFPALLSGLSALLGIASPVNMLFFFRTLSVRCHYLFPVHDHQ